MGRKSKRIVAPFTGKYGTFKPGDQVYAITTGSHRTSIGVAEYVGYIERDTYSWKTREYEKEKYVQIRRPTIRSEAYYKGTDNKVVWSTFRSGVDEVEWRDRQGTTITTLQYNNIIPISASASQLAEAV